LGFDPSSYFFIETHIVFKPTVRVSYRLAEMLLDHIEALGWGIDHFGHDGIRIGQPRRI
jgi:hypothetical protein